MKKPQKSYHATRADLDERKWVLIDAEGQILGRVASQIASIVRGKTKVTFTPSMDMGDFVVVINAGKIKVTGKKLTDKEYHHHSQYPGGLSSIQLQALLKKDPGKALWHAVWGMLPHNRLGRKLITKVKIYGGSEHPHKTQFEPETKKEKA